MIRTLLAFVFVLSLIAPVGRASADVPRINCNAPHQRQLELAPHGNGPLSLTSVYCLRLGFMSRPRTEPLLSPDAQSIAYYEHTESLQVTPLNSDGGFKDFGGDLGVFARFGSETRSRFAFAWASGSDGLWSATHEKMKPLGGWALTPMQPIRIDKDGRHQALPPLEHPAGVLDALSWAGGDGVALAQFGTRGGFHRPERKNPAPTLAIVDAARGTVRETFPFEAIENAHRYIQQGQSAYVQVTNAAATTLPDGRVRAFLDVAGSWVIWTEREAPRVVPNPYPRGTVLRIALSPDGSKLLVAQKLSAASVCGGSGRIGGCKVIGPAVTGPLAALFDLGNGEKLWSIDVTTFGGVELPTPAISPDGRYAFVGLIEDDKPMVAALVDMRDGKTIQTIPSPGYPYAIGFAREGRTVWTYAHGVTTLYDLAPAAQ